MSHRTLSTKRFSSGTPTASIARSVHSAGTEVPGSARTPRRELRDPAAQPRRGNFLRDASSAARVRARSPEAPRGCAGCRPRSSSCSGWPSLHQAEFPIWTSVSRIVRSSCPRHNEFAARAGTGEVTRFRRLVLARLTSSAYCCVIDFSATAPTLLPRPRFCNRNRSATRSAPAAHRSAAASGQTAAGADVPRPATTSSTWRA